MRSKAEHMKRLITLLLLACLLAGSAFARSTRYGEIAVATRSHKSGEPCSGGNISGFLGIQRLPKGLIRTSGLDLQKIEPGNYFVYYQQTEFSGTSNECHELSPPLPSDGVWDKVPKVEIKIASGKVYRISLDRQSSPQIEVLNELPITGMMVGGIYNSVDSLRLWTKLCRDMFPGTEGKYRKKLAASSVHMYEKLFGLAQRELPREEKATRLEQAQQSEPQAMQWCGVELPRAIEKFDYSYAHRIGDVEAFLSTEAKKPSGVQRAP